MAGDLESIRARLEGISEELADLALDRLREAAAGDAAGAVPDAAVEERRLTRARRAVDKAAAILAGPDTGSDDGP